MPTVDDVIDALEREGAVPLPGAHSERTWQAVGGCAGYRFAYPVELRALVGPWLLAAGLQGRVAVEHKDERWMAKEFALATEAWFIRHGWDDLDPEGMCAMMVHAFGRISGVLRRNAPAWQPRAIEEARENKWLEQAKERLDRYFEDRTGRYEVPLYQAAGAAAAQVVDVAVLLSDLNAPLTRASKEAIFMLRVLNLELSITFPPKELQKTMVDGFYQTVADLLNECARPTGGEFACMLKHESMAALATALIGLLPPRTNKPPGVGVHFWLDLTSGETMPYLPALYRALGRLDPTAVARLQAAERMAKLVVDWLLDPLRASDLLRFRRFEATQYGYVFNQQRTSRKRMADPVLSRSNRRFFDHMSDLDADLRVYVTYCLKLMVDWPAARRNTECPLCDRSTR